MSGTRFTEIFKSVLCCFQQRQSLKQNSASSSSTTMNASSVCNKTVTSASSVTMQEQRSESNTQQVIKKAFLHNRNKIPNCKHIFCVSIISYKKYQRRQPNSNWCLQSSFLNNIQGIKVPFLKIFVGKIQKRDFQTCTCTSFLPPKLAALVIDA